jgi:hypothetical protein
MNTCEIGAKSLIGSNGNVSYRLGLMTRAELPTHQKRVAVGGSLGDAIGCDVAAGAGNVLDHKGRAPDFRKPVGENARGEVGRRSRREADQDLHRLAGIDGLRRSCLCHEQHKQGGKQVRSEPHRFLRCPA